MSRKQCLLANNRASACNGFTLLEVLIAIVVLAIGLLGLASLQIVAKRNNFEALQRTQATVIANAAIDRMRAAVAVESQQASILDQYAANDIGGGTITTATDLITRDLMELEQLLDGSETLVSPKLCITHPNPNIPGAPTGSVKVVVAWRGVSKLAIAENGLTAAELATLDDCAKGAFDDFLKQVVIETYISFARRDD